MADLRIKENPSPDPRRTPLLPPPPNQKPLPLSVDTTSSLTTPAPLSQINTKELAKGKLTFLFVRTGLNLDTLINIDQIEPLCTPNLANTHHIYWTKNLTDTSKLAEDHNIPVGSIFLWKSSFSKGRLSILIKASNKPKYTENLFIKISQSYLDLSQPKPVSIILEELRTIVTDQIDKHLAWLAIIERPAPPPLILSMPLPPPDPKDRFRTRTNDLFDPFAYHPPRARVVKQPTPTAPRTPPPPLALDAPDPKHMNPTPLPLGQARFFPAPRVPLIEQPTPAVVTPAAPRTPPPLPAPPVATNREATALNSSIPAVTAITPVADHSPQIDLQINDLVEVTQIDSNGITTKAQGIIQSIIGNPDLNSCHYQIILNQDKKTVTVTYDKLTFKEHPEKVLPKDSDNNIPKGTFLIISPTFSTNQGQGATITTSPNGYGRYQINLPNSESCYVPPFMFLYFPSLQAKSSGSAAPKVPSPLPEPSKKTPPPPEANQPTLIPRESFDAARLSVADINPNFWYGSTTIDQIVRAQAHLLGFKEAPNPLNSTHIFTNPDQSRIPFATIIYLDADNIPLTSLLKHLETQPFPLPIRILIPHNRNNVHWVAEACDILPGPQPENFQIRRHTYDAMSGGEICSKIVRRFNEIENDANYQRDPVSCMHQTDSSSCGPITANFLCRLMQGQSLGTGTYPSGAKELRLSQIQLFAQAFPQGTSLGHAHNLYLHQVHDLVHPQQQTSQTEDVSDDSFNDDDINTRLKLLYELYRLQICSYTATSPTTIETRTNQKQRINAQTFIQTITDLSSTSNFDPTLNLLLIKTQNILEQRVDPSTHDTFNAFLGEVELAINNDFKLNSESKKKAIEYSKTVRETLETMPDQYKNSHINKEIFKSIFRKIINS
ncbi:MAG: hypothetical protein WC860_06535 [Candidatus Margulisiibacteriota bacterium]|jgi:hypothetical protein